MSNINKILIVIVSCVFMICLASVSIVSIVTSNKNDTVTTTSPTAPPSQYSQSESTTQSASTSAPSQTTSAENTTAAPSTPATSLPAFDGLETAILGKWTDSSGLSGYEFLEGGKVNWTYADLGQFGVPFDGYASGLYSIDGDMLTVKFSIYTATIKKVYRVSVNGNELSMYDLEDFETSTYARAS